jgi:hypothetical protein
MRVDIAVKSIQAVLTVFARVQTDAATVHIGGDPVPLLLVVERDPRYLAYIG